MLVKTPHPPNRNSGAVSLANGLATAAKGADGAAFGDTSPLRSGIPSHLAAPPATLFLCILLRTSGTIPKMGGTGLEYEVMRRNPSRDINAIFSVEAAIEIQKDGK